MAVNEGLAHLSNNLIYSAIAVYALTLVGYAADFAFGRLSASGRVGSAQDSRGADDSRVLAGHATGAVAGLVAPSGEGVMGRPGGRPGLTDRIGRIAVSLTVLAFGLHLASTVSRGLAAGRFPFGNMYEFSSAAALAATGVFLVLLARYDVRYLGVVVLMPVVLTLGLAVTVLYVDAEQLVPALQSYWLAIHVSAAIVSSGIFTVGMAATSLYLWRERSERRGAVRGLVSRLPAAQVLDWTAYRIHALAFPLWTFAVIAGAIWAEDAWGRYWGWDPKETWAFITWVVYACYLHARATAGWRGRAAAWVAMAGYACFLFNYFGVNMWITGLHSYAGI